MKIFILRDNAEVRKKANIKKELNEIIKCDIDKKNQLDKKLFAINKLIESAKELLKDK